MHILESIRIREIACSIALLALAGPVGAALSSAELAKLGTSLTPLGAESAGDPANGIPAWDGGAISVPANVKAGLHYPDPFAADKPLFTITRANASTYADKLTPGQLAMLNKYPDYKMVVYPTRRTAAFPKAYYDETREAAASAKLVPGGNGISGATGGIPFPIPKDGQEAIWNHLLHYRGDTYSTTWFSIPVLADGSYTPARNTIEYDYMYGNLSRPVKEREPGRIFNFLQSFSAPPRLAGTLILVYEPLDQVKTPRTTWTYAPGQRRVRLAPEVAYDNPAGSSDGLRTNDDFTMFNGAIDRYDWKLLGKKEVYVPYNSYRISDDTLRLSDVIRPGHLNQDLARYELHRVWVVEATLKRGVSHIYAKRVFYLDEDSWAALLTDKYDARGQLWRMAEANSISLYDRPMPAQTVEVHYDLVAGRYLVMGLRDSRSYLYQPVKRSAHDFTPARLRDLGTR